MTRFLADDASVEQVRPTLAGLLDVLRAADFPRTERLPLAGGPLDVLLDPLNAVRTARGRSNLLQPSGLPGVHRRLLRRPDALTLHRLFTAGEPLPTAQVAPLLRSLLPALTELGALTELDGRVRAEILAVPYRGRIYLSDALQRRAEPDFCYLGRATFAGIELALADLALAAQAAGRRARVLDLGCGPAVGGLALADLADEVVGSDLVPRAVRFGRLNAALNGIDHARFVVSDVTAELDGTFDLVITHPPGVWSDDDAGGVAAQHGGSDFGLELPQRMIRDALAITRPGGVVNAVLFAPVLAEGPYAVEVARRICADRPAAVVLHPILEYVEHADAARYRAHGVTSMVRYIAVFRPAAQTSVCFAPLDRSRWLSSRLRTVPARLAGRVSRGSR